MSVPHWIRDAVDVLADRVGHSIFISTIFAYADYVDVGQDESAPRAVYDAANGTDVMHVSLAALNANMAWYGPLKASCEDEVHA